MPVGTDEIAEFVGDVRLQKRRKFVGPGQVLGDLHQKMSYAVFVKSVRHDVIDSRHDIG